MRKDSLTVIVLALTAVFAAATAVVVRTAHTQAATRLPSQSAMPISELTNAAAKDLPVQPFGPFTSP